VYVFLVWGGVAILYVQSLVSNMVEYAEYGLQNNYTPSHPLPTTHCHTVLIDVSIDASVCAVGTTVALDVWIGPCKTIGL
jgi:hypothetical protein